MKKVQKITVIVFSVILAGILVSCPNPLRNINLNELEEEPLLEGSAHYGSLRINGGDESASRSILPPEDLKGEVDSYRVEFTGHSGGEDDFTVQPYVEGDDILSIPVGDWVVTLYGMNIGGNDIASGIPDGGNPLTISESGNSAITVTLSPIDGSGDGSLDYTINFPAADVDGVTITLDPWPIGGSDEFPLVEGTDYNANFATTGTLLINTALASNQYFLSVVFSRDVDGSQVDRPPFYEIVQIYDYLTSSKSFTLTSDDFTQPPDAPTDFTATPQSSTDIELTWIDSSNTESGFEIERNVDGGGFTDLTDPTAGATSYIDGTIGSGSHQYEYQIRSVNKYGASTWVSAGAIETYEIVYDANEENGGSAPGNQTKMETINLALADNTGGLTKTGHTLIGWNTESNGGGTHYALGGTYTADVDDTLYAEWAITHTITFNVNEGSGSMSAQTIAQGTSANLTANAFTRTGYTFDGWATTLGGAVAYADQTSYTMGNSDVTLFAVWRPNISLITPDGNSSVSPDTNIVIVFSDSLDGTTKGTVSFASPAITFTDGDNAVISFSNTNKTNDTITVTPNDDLQSTNYTGISISGFKKSDSSDVPWSDPAYYFPVRGAMDLYFPFTNGLLTDASGRGVVLAPSGGPTLTTGHDGSANDAYSFDGVDDYMQVNGDLGIDCDADFTISAWIYLTSIGEYRAIVSNYHTTGAPGLMFRVNKTTGANNSLDLSQGYSDANAITTGTWLHVVAVYTEANSKVQFYVDGVGAGYTSTGYNIGDPLLMDPRNKFTIGADYLFGPDPRYFPGTIDEVRFYKYALTSDEVGNLYRNDDINDNAP